ncbi:MAG TPA: hypothetical protein VGF13_15400, partial [Verrucomicrobiae bacterium]
MKTTLLKLCAMAACSLLLFSNTATAQDDAVPGTRPAAFPAVTDLASSKALASALAPVYTESGALTLSLDGMGTRTSNGTIRVEKPAGATVRKAFLGSATTGFSKYQLLPGDVKLAGSNFVWSQSTSNAISSFNY